MWFVLNRREAASDVAYWPGRRALAALDALAWPALGAAAVIWSPVPWRLVGAVWVATCAVAAVSGLQRALWANHRYRFTTWRWGRVVLAVLILGLLIQWISHV